MSSLSLFLRSNPQLHHSSRILFKTMLRSVFTLSVLAASALGCADHENHQYPGHQSKKRAEPGAERDWEYATSYDWGSGNPGAHQLEQLIGKRLD